MSKRKKDILGKIKLANLLSLRTFGKDSEKAKSVYYISLMKTIPDIKDLAELNSWLNNIFYGTWINFFCASSKFKHKIRNLENSPDIATGGAALALKFSEYASELRSTMQFDLTYFIRLLNTCRSDRTAYGKLEKTGFLVFKDFDQAQFSPLDNPPSLALIYLISVPYDEIVERGGVAFDVYLKEGRVKELHKTAEKIVRGIAKIDLVERILKDKLRRS
jgi:hypothetical protein